MLRESRVSRGNAVLITLLYRLGFYRSSVHECVFYLFKKNVSAVHIDGSPGTPRFLRP